MNRVSNNVFQSVLSVLVLASTLSSCLFSSDSCPELESTKNADSTRFPACTGQLKPALHPPIPSPPETKERYLSKDSVVKLTRVTDNASAKSREDVLRHFYSRRQAWNLDESLLDLGNKIVSAVSYIPIEDKVPFSSERVWSNTDSKIMYGIRYNPRPNELSEYNFKTRSYKTLFRFEEYTKCTLGHGEGNLSNDDTFLVVTCTNSNNITDIISLNLKTKLILGKMTAKSNINWASISPSGSYVIVENNSHPDPNPVLLRYSRRLENEVLLMEHPSHGDLTLDDNGNDIHVMISSNTVFYVRIKDRQQVKLGISTRQFKLGSGHISCRNLQRPGWCYLSSYQSGHVGAFKIGGAESNLDELVDLRAWKKQGPNAYEHWGFHHSSSRTYHAQAKASVSPSGTKIIFSSDWGHQAAVDEFVFSID